ncbi:AraC family transcriptional regulator [Pseudoalteromonas maricaloris]|uniref:helix-turn-helix domain-containing protein n=1 Tax=Pseudoalteromonas maricaloris TaxID=184924 RepID=UPI0021AE0FFB|nr:helix-turn-helix transcriptional regulator [Pseudoalteromonas flavipulchra]USE68275.1 AraC family transcriptional regulator [Pseudoalteromonas flavipulchra]
MSVNLIPTVLYSAMVGVVLSALLRIFTITKPKQTMYLSGLLVLLFIHIMGELYIFTGVFQYAPAIAGFQLPVRMLMGPALYFYAYKAMFPNSKISLKAHLLALFGPAVVFLSMIPFIFSITPEQKLALANPSTRDPALWKIAIFVCLFTAVTFIVVTFAYLIAALRLHSQHRKQLMDKYSAIEQRAMDWLKIILLLWGLVWLFYAANYAASFFGFNWFAMRSLLPVFEFTVLVSFLNLALKQLELSEPEETKRPEPQPREAVISHDKMQLIADKLTIAMSEKALFKDEDLSLNGLSTAISVSENHISETLSQFMNTNFFQFVNGYRIEEAKNLLTNSDMLVSSIAFEVGFKSKSTFNSAFKKRVGATPTDYKKNN